jgi:hypothetical protein
MALTMLPDMRLVPVELKGFACTAHVALALPFAVTIQHAVAVPSPVKFPYGPHVLVGVGVTVGFGSITPRLLVIVEVLLYLPTVAFGCEFDAVCLELGEEIVSVDAAVLEEGSAVVVEASQVPESISRAGF